MPPDVPFHHPDVELPPEQRADTTGLAFGLNGLGQDTLLVLALEDAALRYGDELGIGAAEAVKAR